MDKPNSPADPWSKDFWRAFSDELDLLKGPEPRRSQGGPADDSTPEERLDTARDPITRAHTTQLVGLAFSGGGIRSATFNLGVLQGLAQLKLLSSFDYLSTVSGGGYIGSWLMAWVKRRRENVNDVKLGLRPDWVTQPGNSEPEEIRFLRRFSNYLTPKLGWLGADMWTVIAIYIRNVLLNFLVLTAAFALLLLAPRWLALLLRWLPHVPVSWLAGTAGLALFWAAVGIVRSMRYFGRSSEDESAEETILPFRKIGADIELSPAGETYCKSPYADFSLDITFKVAGRGHASVLLWVPLTAGAAPSGPGAAPPAPARVYLSSAEQAARFAAGDRDPFATGQINGRKPARAVAVMPGDNCLKIICSHNLCTVQINGLTINKLRVNRGLAGEEPASGFAIGLRNTRGAIQFTNEITSKNIESPSSAGATQEQVQRNVIIPLFVAAFAATVLFGLSPHVPEAMRSILEKPANDLWSWVSWAGFVGAGSGGMLLLAQMLAWSWSRCRKAFSNWRRAQQRKAAEPAKVRKRRWPATIKRLVIAALSMGFAAAIGGATVRSLYFILHNRSIWEATTWGPPALIGAYLLTVILYIGFLGRQLPDERREWWSRLSAWLLIYALGWVVICGVAFYAPVILVKIGGWLQPITAAWIISTATGLIAARSAATGSEESSKVTEMVAKIAPYIFVAGFFFFLSWGVHAFVPLFGGMGAWSGPTNRWDRLDLHWVELQQVGWWPLACATVAALLVTFVLSLRLDINQFSMHLLYRNRLGRCYLGASNRQRRAQPFTGFARGDDLQLAELRDIEFRKDAVPYPIINASLNLVGGNELAWQQRKAASFVFTPLYCGYDFPELPPGFVQTERFASEPLPVTLATAMAISGAAASPNMGYHTSPAPAFLMTVFNVRLGWWLGNPRREEGFEKSGPGNVLLSLTAELFGLTNEQGKYIYLSDGGHFENLGIYELIRRRCRFVVACDAEEDRPFAFGGLGNALEKCRADLGVDIEIDVESIRRRSKEGHSAWHCAIGKIYYSRVDANARDGIFVYLKSSLTGDEPTDLLRYAAENPEFPHQTTADQWFDESQFESYRALGSHIVLDVFGAVDVAAKLATKNTEELFLELAQRWYPPSAATRESFTKHTRATVAIYDELRKNTDLAFLNEQVYPEWRELLRKSESVLAHVRDPLVSAGPKSLADRLPDDPKQLAAGFYFCNSVFQLMEDVYLDLHLEEEFDHPDNRGWMNFFKHWSWAPMVRVAWSINASTYGARFQTFCKDHLGLSVGRIHGDYVGVPQGLIHDWDAVCSRSVEAPGRLTKLIADTIVDWLGRSALEPEVLAAVAIEAAPIYPGKDDRCLLADKAPTTDELNEVARLIEEALKYFDPRGIDDPIQSTTESTIQIRDLEWMSTATLVELMRRGATPEILEGQAKKIAAVIAFRAANIDAYSAALRTKKLKALNETELELIEWFFVYNPSLLAVAKIFRFDLIPGYTGNGSGPDPTDDEIHFPVGFAIIADLPAGPQLAFLRIRDHLRRIGLGRLAIKTVLGKEPRITFKLREMHPGAHEVPTAEDQLRFKRLFDSVQPGQPAADKR